MPPINPLPFKHFVLAVSTPACLHPVLHCTTASPYLSLSSAPLSSFSFPTAVAFGAHPYRYQGRWERSGPALSPSQPFLFQRTRKPRVKAGLKEKSQPTSAKFEETKQVWVQRKLLGGGEDRMSVVPSKMVSLEWFAWNHNEKGLKT